MNTHILFIESQEIFQNQKYLAQHHKYRSTLSVILNYIEGYARNKKLVKQNFWEISYGSLKESKYLLNFCFKEKFLNEDDYKKGLKMSEEIGAMLWRAIDSLKISKDS